MAGGSESSSRFSSTETLSRPRSRFSLEENQLEGALPAPPHPPKIHHSAAGAETRPKSDGGPRAARGDRGCCGEPRAGPRCPRSGIPPPPGDRLRARPRTNRPETADVPDIKFIDLSSSGRRKQTRTRDREKEGVFR